ncbi:MAG: AAA family ATPase, partial [Pseudomonadota bacterium]
MRLKKIRLAGFKSFVDPTNIPFPGDMTAIVGPNGCGKSNVIDAVRWVLGESSAKNLRGDAMTDVIFNGSSARKPVSQCSVELVFDNSAGRIAGEFARYNELSVKRVVTKDAISSYLLNSSKCRKKDITDLFLGTGLGPRSYAIIEQGMISRLIESKPHELRVFIEEAAGISKYKERRRETQTRIQHTNDNLSRLDDVRGELSEQLEKLKRQASAATKYKAFKQEERELKANLATLRWMAQTKVVEISDKAILDFQQQLSDFVASRQNDESTMQSLKNELSILKQSASDIQTRVFSIGNEITKIEQSQIFAKKRLGQIQQEKQQMHASKETLHAEIHSIDDELSELTSQLDVLEPEKFVIEQQYEEIEAANIETQDRLRSIEQQHKTEDDAFFQKKHQLQQLHGKLQQTLSLQQRTQARISELETEKSELGVSDDNVIGDLRVLIENEKRALATEEEVLTEQQERVENDQLIERQTEKDVSDSRNALFRENARLESLLALQSESTNQIKYPDWIEKDNLISIWQAFSVDMAYSKCLETVLQLFDHVQVYKGEKPLVEQWQAGPSISLWIQDTFTEEKEPESLAYYLKQPKVPQIFNHIIITDNLKIAAQHASETSHLSYIDKDGNWLAKSMMLRPKTSKGKLERADEVRKAEANIQTLKEEIGAKDAELASLSEALRNQKSILAAQKTKLEGVKKVLGERETNLKFAELQAAQQKEQQVKILNELEKQRLIMNEEAESLDLLNFQIEELSITVADGEDEKRQRESTTVQLKAELQVLADKMSATQSDLHQHQLQLQQIKNSLQLANEQQKAKHHMLTS